jgi:hypothetical protein
LDAAILEVVDTEKGVPPEVQKRLFDPFYTSNAPGTGLGLSIAGSPQARSTCCCSDAIPRREQLHEPHIIWLETLRLSAPADFPSDRHQIRGLFWALMGMLTIVGADPIAFISSLFGAYRAGLSDLVLTLVVGRPMDDQAW